MVGVVMVMVGTAENTNNGDIYIRVTNTRLILMSKINRRFIDSNGGMGSLEYMVYIHDEKDNNDVDDDDVDDDDDEIGEDDHDNVVVVVLGSS
jgi:hypothetical protein